MHRPAVFALLLAALTPAARADLIFDNGQPNDLTTVVSDRLVVRDSPAGLPTTLNVLPGGAAFRADVRGASRLVLDGGQVGIVETFGTSTAFVARNGTATVFTTQTLFAHEGSVITFGSGSPSLLQLGVVGADGKAASSAPGAT